MRGKTACALGVFLSVSAASGDSKILTHAHSHNDYYQEKPLWDALKRKFVSVEADVLLSGNALLIGHDWMETDPHRTLESLYLDPLLTLIRENHGFVYEVDTPLWLLIDIKSDGETTYRKLRKVLERYSEILTEYDSYGVVKQGAVNVLISGNRPWDSVEREKIRYANIDGRLEDLGGLRSETIMPWISDEWGKYFVWNGEGPFPADESEQLRRMVSASHARGCKIRFWGTPQTNRLWKELANADVDFLETDDLQRLEQFFAPQISVFEFVRPTFSERSMLNPL